MVGDALREQFVETWRELGGSVAFARAQPASPPKPAAPEPTAAPPPTQAAPASKQAKRASGNGATLGFEAQFCLTSLRDLVEANQSEAATPAATRELPLPRLITAKLRVKGAERAIEAAT